VKNPRIFVINIQTFLTYARFENDQYYNYDLREPKRKIVNPDKVKVTTKPVATTDDWTNIPYYPTTKERREMIANTLISQGRQVPNELIMQIEKDKIKEIQNDVFNKDLNNDANSNNSNSQEDERLHLYHQQIQNQTQNQIQNQNIYYSRMNRTQNSPNPMNRNNIPPNINKYSPEYAKYIGHKPKATASARIRLGGVY
jgi:hypothetical protein